MTATSSFKCQYADSASIQPVCFRMGNAVFEMLRITNVVKIHATKMEDIRLSQSAPIRPRHATYPPVRHRMRSEGTLSARQRTLGSSRFPALVHEARARCPAERAETLPPQPPLAPKPPPLAPKPLPPNPSNRSIPRAPPPAPPAARAASNTVACLKSDT